MLNFTGISMWKRQKHRPDCMNKVMFYSIRTQKLWAQKPNRMSQKWKHNSFQTWNDNRFKKSLLWKKKSLNFQIIWFSLSGRTVMRQTFNWDSVFHSECIRTLSQMNLTFELFIWCYEIISLSVKLIESNQMD